MVRWHHGLSGHKPEHTLGTSEGRGVRRAAAQEVAKTQTQQHSNGAHQRTFWSSAFPWWAVSKMAPVSLIPWTAVHGAGRDRTRPSESHFQSPY